MNPITIQDLRECLTLLIAQRQDDGEGGWKEEWKRGPTLWASLWPLMGNKGELLKSLSPCFRVVIRAGINLPKRFGFLWTLRHGVKRLEVISAPVPIQYNRFLCMTAREETNA
jgi:hypothetical protein